MSGIIKTPSILSENKNYKSTSITNKYITLNKGLSKITLLDKQGKGFISYIKIRAAGDVAANLKFDLNIDGTILKLSAHNAVADFILFTILNGYKVESTTSMTSVDNTFHRIIDFNDYVQPKEYCYPLPIFFNNRIQIIGTADRTVNMNTDVGISILYFEEI